MIVNGIAQDWGLEIGAMHAILVRDSRRQDFDAPLETESWQQ
jgi:hypothetical protein